MVDGLNRVQVLGNLGNDPELKVTQGGQAVLNFTVAANESYLDRNNERQEKTEWIRCALWGKRAEALAKILTKGAKVYVEGSFSTSSYEKNGAKQYSTQVNVREVILCGSGGGSGGANTGPGASTPRGGQQRSFGGGGGGGGSSRTPPPPADDGFGDGGAGDFAGGASDDDIPFAFNMTMSRKMVP